MGSAGWFVVLILAAAEAVGPHFAVVSVDAVGCGGCWEGREEGREAEDDDEGKRGEAHRRWEEGDQLQGLSYVDRLAKRAAGWTLVSEEGAEGEEAGVVPVRRGFRGRSDGTFGLT